MKKATPFFIIITVAVACNTTPEKSSTQNDHAPATMTDQPTDSLPVYTAAMLDVKEDLVCGMPVTTHIADTAHHAGKVYGFCSAECRDEFVKTPEKYRVGK